jgi:hypothetical protein
VARSSSRPIAKAHNKNFERKFSISTGLTEQMMMALRVETIMALTLALSAAMHEPKEDADVTKFLSELGIEEYVPAFAEHKINNETLLGLTAGDLKEIGVKALGPRKQILKKLMALRDPGTGDRGPVRLHCNEGIPTNFTLPYAMLIRYGGQSNSENPCSFQDINGDGLPDYVCAAEEEGNTEGVLWSVRCSYINTGKGWQLV